MVMTYPLIKGRLVSGVERTGAGRLPENRKSISMKKASKPLGGARAGAGRPRKPGGMDPVSAVRFSREITAKIDKWGESHEVGRSEAIRRLVELGLKANGK